MSLPRQEQSNRIADQLNQLAAVIKTRSRAGLTDGNQILEPIAKRLFNALFGWNLVNLNAEQANFPAADLGDRAQRIAIQVTNEDSSAKITNTVAKAVAHNLGKDFDRLIIFFLLPKKPGLPRQFNPPDNGPEIVTWDIADLLTQLKELDDLAALTRAADILNEELGRPPITSTDAIGENEKGATGDIKHPDGTWFIERRAEREVLKHLRKHRITIGLKGGRQLGKTQIAYRVCQQMASEGWQSVNIDLRDEFADGDYIMGHTFLRRLAEKIADQTNSDHQILSVFDQNGTPTALKAYVDALKISHPENRMLLRLERVDALAGQPCCSVVLSGLRVLHNAQRSLGEQAWVQMLLVHTITPRQTVTSWGSVFDVAQIIEVPDFSEEELQKLVKLYDLVGVNVAKLHSFLGGHPALSQLTFEAMRDDKITLEQIIDDSKKGGIYKPFLDRLTTEFRALPNAKRLANSFRELAQGKILDSEDTFDVLLALGVVKGTYSGDARIRCELYSNWLCPRI